MERLDEKMSRELRARKRHAKMESVADFFTGVAEDVADACNDGINAIRSFLGEKKQQRIEQDMMRRRFESFVDMHDPSKIGTVEYEDLENNAGMRVVVYTENGPLIKTFYTQEPVIGVFARDGASKYGWYNLCELANNVSVAYEGYCPDSASSNKFPHYYYANLIKRNYTEYGAEDAIRAKQFSGFVRSDKGRFSKIDTSLPVCYYDIAPYMDLEKTFETAYNQAIANAELQA